MQYDLFNAGIHIELTSNCNSRCLDCGRFVRGTDILNSFVQFGNKGILDKKYVENIFDEEVASNARYVMFSGTYGDASLHPEFHTVLDLIAECIDRVKQQRIKKGLPEKLVLQMETNGGMHTPDWWSRAGKIIKNKFHSASRIIFAIDGADDETHQKYRRGVSMPKILENASAVRKQEVRTIWSFIEFEHNSHQVETAKQMANDLGFYDFKIRRSRLRTKTTLPQNVPNTTQKNKRISKETLNWTDEQKALFDKTTTSNASEKFYYEGKYKPEFLETDIVCEWREKNQISIDYTGRVWQCCYFSNFYHSPYEETQIPRIEQGEDVNLKSQQYENLDYYENQYENNWNNIKQFKLTEIMNHKFFVEDLPDSLNNKIDDKNNPRIYRCGKFCGSRTRKLDKVLNKNASK